MARIASVAAVDERRSGREEGASTCTNKTRGGMKGFFLGRKRALFTTFTTLSIASLIGCSIPFTGDSTVNDQDQKKSYAELGEHPGKAEDKRWLRSGSLVLSRPAPSIASQSGTIALGFAPMSRVVTADGTHSGNWLLLDTKKGEAVLMRGADADKKARVEGLERVAKGHYQVLHKQANPAWYASDSYFSRRGLSIPPEGSAKRFLRGALGSHVIFLDKDTPLHSSPHYSEDVGGIRIDPMTLEGLFQELEIGTSIEVR